MSDKRCPWCASSELYIRYHDEEWGVPCYDGRELFELLNLEGAQAGLSWITILNKRENYRRLFDNFDPVKIARYRDTKLDKLLTDTGIVRNRLKVYGVRTNAKLYCEMEKNGESFAEFLWGFVDHRTLQNEPDSLAEVAATTEESDAMSKALKKRGFKFVGSTICYAFMQASGMVNDHINDCPSKKKCRTKAAPRHMPAGWPGRKTART